MAKRTADSSNVLATLAVDSGPFGRAARAALEHVPAHRHPRVVIDSDSPWLMVHQIPGPDLAVWIASGAVYEVSCDGSVSEEPLERKADAEANG